MDNREEESRLEKLLLHSGFDQEHSDTLLVLFGGSITKAGSWNRGLLNVCTIDHSRVPSTIDLAYTAIVSDFPALPWGPTEDDALTRFGGLLNGKAKGGVHALKQYPQLE